MAEREPRRRQPAVFKEIIENFENSNLRNFEMACQDFHSLLEATLNAKSRRDNSGLRETGKIRIKSKKAMYDFWIAEENTTNGESKNIVVKARPVSDFVVSDRLVLRASVNGEIFDLAEDGDGEEPMKEDDFPTIQGYTEMLKFMQEYLPDPNLEEKK